MSGGVGGDGIVEFFAIIYQGATPEVLTGKSIIWIKKEALLTLALHALSGVTELAIWLIGESYERPS